MRISTMKRWHDEYLRTHREWKKHWLSHVESNIRNSKPGVDPFKVDCLCDQQKGRFRKMKAFDCGQVHCYMCHWGKYPKRSISVQEEMADLKLKEGLEDIDV